MSHTDIYSRCHDAGEEDIDIIPGPVDNHASTSGAPMPLERILSQKPSPSSSTQYLCKWKHLDYSHCTWVLSENIDPKYIAAYAQREILRRRPAESWVYERTGRPAFEKITDSYLHSMEDELMDFQVSGFNWLVYLWSKGDNGILVDDMGLGRIVQAVVFLSYLFHEREQYGPFLVVAPSSCISAWEGYFAKWAPTLYVATYTGTAASRGVVRLHEFERMNVLLASYDAVLEDVFHLKDINWTATIFDEGHRWENSDSQLYEIVGSLSSESRTVITGCNPSQNSDEELLSLIHFIMPGKLNIPFKALHERIMVRIFTGSISTSVALNERKRSQANSSRLRQEEKYLVISAVSTGDDVKFNYVIAPVCAVFESVLEDELRYRALLAYRSSTAQKILDVLQMLLDYPCLKPDFKTRLRVALMRLSRKSGLYPTCLTLKDVEKGDSPLAAGHFADIWKGKFREQSVCVKIVKMYERSQVQHTLAAFSKEAIVWAHLSHPNLLPFYGIYHLEDIYGRICLISPWMENGNINQYLELHPEANRLLLAFDIFDGLAYLHRNSIVHGDLKGVNILITKSKRACIADFGLSTVIDSDILKWTSVQSTARPAGTLRWQAPELMFAEDDHVYASEQSDIYAYGCICYEVFTGQIPFFECIRDANVIYKVAVLRERPSRPAPGSAPFIEWGLTDAIWALMEDCWSQEPLARPSIKRIFTRLVAIGHPIDGRPQRDSEILSPSHFRNAMHGTTDRVTMDDVEEILTLLS